MLLLFLNSFTQLSPQTSHCNTLPGTSATWSYLLYNNIADHKAKWPATSVSPAFTVAQIDKPNICTLLSHLHSLFHPSAKVLKAFLQNFIELTKADVTYLNNLTQTCTICQRTNPNSNICPTPFPPHQMCRHLPSQDWQVDFTHMPPVKRVKFLLVFVDTFSGWIKAFPTTNTRAPTVACLILTEILPRFGMPFSLQ